MGSGLSRTGSPSGPGVFGLVLVRPTCRFFKYCLAQRVWGGTGLPNGVVKVGLGTGLPNGSGGVSDFFSMVCPTGW